MCRWRRPGGLQTVEAMTTLQPSARAEPPGGSPGEGTHATARTMRRPLALLGISLGYFMVLLDMTVLAVAEPDLAVSLHTSIAGLQWATTGYTVVFGALLLSAGAVAHIWARPVPEGDRARC